LNHRTSSSSEVFYALGCGVAEPEMLWCNTDRTP